MAAQRGARAAGGFWHRSQQPERRPPKCQGNPRQGPRPCRPLRDAQERNRPQARVPNDRRSTKDSVIGNKMDITGHTICQSVPGTRACQTLEVQGYGLVQTHFGKSICNGEATAADNRPEVPLAGHGKVPEPFIIDRRQIGNRGQRQPAGQSTRQHVGHLFGAQDPGFHRLLDEPGRHARKMGYLVDGEFCWQNLSPIRKDI